ncbi:MAG: hypothetical protein FWG10_01690 [Eubacteriaceae bacterium]|nr:hypothetical protein [Eubacteriaceae bacterium]
MQDFSLEPMGVGMLIDRSFKIYRSNFRSVIFFSLLIGGTFTMITSLINVNRMQSTQTLWSIFSELVYNFENPQNLIEEISNLNANTISPRSWVVSSLNSVFIQPLVTGGLTLLVFNICTGRERPETPVGWFNLVKPLYSKIIGSQLALSVITLGIYFALILLVIILSLLFAFSSLPDFLVFIVMLALLLPSVLGTTVYSMLALPVAIAEERFGFKFIKRAFQLLFLRFWKSLGLMLATTTLVSIISSVFRMALAFLPPIFRAVLDAMISGLVSPVSVIASVLLYLDIRISKEGYDLELRNAMLNNQTVGPL